MPRVVFGAVPIGPIPAAHTHSASDITDFAAAVDTLTADEREQTRLLTIAFRALVRVLSEQRVLSLPDELIEESERGNDDPVSESVEEAAR